MPAPMPAEAKLRVARKVRMLIRDEGKKPDQAFAMAMSMEKAGRLGERGGYEAVPKRKRNPSRETEDESGQEADAELNVGAS